MPVMLQQPQRHLYGNYGTMNNVCTRQHGPPPMRSSTPRPGYGMNETKTTTIQIQITNKPIIPKICRYHRPYTNNGCNYGGNCNFIHIAFEKIFKHKEENNNGDKQPSQKETNVKLNEVMERLVFLENKMNNIEKEKCENPQKTDHDKKEEKEEKNINISSTNKAPKQTPKKGTKTTTKKTTKDSKKRQQNKQKQPQQKKKNKNIKKKQQTQQQRKNMKKNAKKKKKKTKEYKDMFEALYSEKEETNYVDDVDWSSNSDKEYVPNDDYKNEEKETKTLSPIEMFKKQTGYKVEDSQDGYNNFLFWLCNVLQVNVEKVTATDKGKEIFDEFYENVYKFYERFWSNMDTGFRLVSYAYIRLDHFGINHSKTIAMTKEQSSKW